MSPYCLSCGAALGAPSPTFGKAPAKGSALPWILGGIGLFVVLGFGGCVLLLVVTAGSAKPDAPPEATATAVPRLEPASTAAAADAAPAASIKVAVAPTVKQPIVTAPVRPTSTINDPFGTPNPTVTVRPTATPTAPPTVPPPVVLGPFPRAKAQGEVDRVAATLASCSRSTGPFGAGSVRIDFEPDGRTGTLSRPPFASTPVGNCITSRFLAIKIGKFQGSTTSIERSFIIQQ